MKRALALLLAVGVLASWTVIASAEMKEGLWEMTIKTEMKGMPTSMPPTTVRQCITNKEPVPQKPEKGQCVVKNQKVSGDTVQYTIECKEADSTVITSGTVTYKGTTFSGSSQTVVKAKGEGDMTMNTTMSGKYLGPCPKK
jgi:hypothetical protein